MHEIIADNNPKRTQPVLIFIVCCLLAVSSWWVLTEQRQNSAKTDLKKQAEIFTRYILSDLDARVPALQRAVHRWEEEGGTAKRLFVADAQHYIADNPGLQAIEWVDESYHVRWIVPFEGNEKAENLYLGFEARRLRSLEEAKDKSIPTMTKPVNLVQGGKGLLVYFPIRLKNEFNGFLLVVFNTQKWIDFVFRHDILADQLKNFEVSVSLAGDNVFYTEQYELEENQEWANKHKTNVFGHELIVTVQPTLHFFEQNLDYTAGLVAFVFICFGVILACLVYYLKKASLTSAQMKISMASLDRESRERLRAEKEAISANEAKSKFLTAMSHEIRTPLNGILGILQLVEQTKLPVNVSDKLKIARESGFFLLNLVNQVLDFARIEAGSVERDDEDFLLGSMISDLHSMFKMQADSKYLEFDYKIIGPDDVWLTGDYGHIKQILFNLIGNAIKFTRDGAVTIVVKVNETDDDAVNLIFDVIDTGPGISWEEQDIIFEEFKQSEAGRKSGMGTGLGLSISKQLAEVMGGKLTVTSAAGHGTTFTFTTEVVKAQEQQNSQARNGDISDLPPLRILIAEDNSVNQIVISEMLVADGHTVTLVDDGTEVVEEIRNNSNQYDLILMDIQMPHMNGVDATLAIRTLIPDPEKLPIFALTANAFASQVEQYSKVGMQATLTKPIILADLRALIFKYFSGIEKHPNLPESNSSRIRVRSKSEYLDVDTIDSMIGVISIKRFLMLAETLPSSFDKELAELEEKGLNASDVQKLAHKFRGMAANVGFSLLADKAREIEEQANDHTDTLQMRLSLKQITTESLNALRRYCDAREDDQKRMTS